MKAFKGVLLFFIVFEGALLLQGLVGRAVLPRVRLDLIWLLILYLGFFVPLFPGGLCVFLIAWAEEVVGVPFHGLLVLSDLLVYFLARLLHQHIFFEKGASRFIWVAFFTLLQKTLQKGLLLWQGYLPEFPWNLLVESSVLSGLASFPLFAILKRGTR